MFCANLKSEAVHPKLELGVSILLVEIMFTQPIYLLSFCCCSVWQGNLVIKAGPELFEGGGTGNRHVAINSGKVSKDTWVLTKWPYWMHLHLLFGFMPCTLKSILNLFINLIPVLQNYCHEAARLEVVERVLSKESLHCLKASFIFRTCSISPKWTFEIIWLRICLKFFLKKEEFSCAQINLGRVIV